MALTIDLPRELEEQLSEEAARRGIAAQEYVLRLVREQLREAGEERRSWHALSAPALQRVWDNEADAVYDNWRELYGVPEG